MDKNTDREWAQVKELKLVRSVKHDWLTYHDKPGTKDDHYTVKPAHLTDVSTAFGAMDITATTKLELVKKEGDNRHVSLAIPDASAETYWSKRSALGSLNQDEIQATSDISECYKVNPNAPTFESNVGTVGEDFLMKLEGMETAKDEAKARWCKVKTDSLEGWIREDDPSIAKASAFDWPGFIIVKEDGDQASDPLIDYAKLSPLFKTIVNQIDTDSNKDEISEPEIQAALKNARLSGKLSRIICLNPSEWWTDSAMNQWQRVFDRIGEPNTTRLRTRIQNLCWWSDVASKVSGFPSAPKVYHWNPVAFVEQMKRMRSGITFDELKRITGATNANINKHLNGINRALKECDIDSELKVAHFLAQVIHESGGFDATAEDVSEEAAEDVYGGFKGRGLIHVTYEENYKKYGEFAGEDVTSSLANKQKLESDPHAAKSAGWFWSHHVKLNDDAEANDFIYITYKVNGGFNGYDDRLKWLLKGVADLCQDESIRTDYTLPESKVNDILKGAFGWGLWHDPDSDEKGCTKDATLALTGYQRFVALHDADGAPTLSGPWYNKVPSRVRTFVDGRIASIGGGV